MPGFMLNNRQVRTIINIAGLKEPIRGSPLQFLPENGQLHPDDPVFEYLVKNHLIEPAKSGWRINRLFAYALETSVRPEEVISVGVDISEHPGFAVARRSNFWCECTVNREGVTKFYFPLSRSTVIMSLTDAFSGNSPEPPNSGFHFIGPAQDAFLLNTVMRELREYPVGLTVIKLKDAVVRSAAIPRYTMAFAATAGADVIEKLARSPEAIEAALGRLVVAGHLSISGGSVKPSTTASTALSGYPEATFGITRTEIRDSGPASQSLMIIKTGGRKLVFRVRYERDRPPYFEWIEMDRRQIRLMVMAVLLGGKETEHLTRAINAPPVSVSQPILKVVPPHESPPAAALPSTTRQKAAAVTPGFCTACGAKIKPGAAFCSQCGAVVKKKGLT